MTDKKFELGFKLLDTGNMERSYIIENMGVFEALACLLSVLEAVEVLMEDVVEANLPGRDLH